MNNQNFTVVPLFSTPIFLSGETYEMSESFFDFIKNVEKTTDVKAQGNNPSWVVPHTNSTDSYILEKKEFADLKKFIERQLDLYVHGALKISPKHKFYITQSWLNFNEHGEDHHRHYHPNSLISGVFFIDGEYCPTVMLYSDGDPPFGKGWVFGIEEVNIYNSGKWSCDNKKNAVLMFPSTTEHFVDDYIGAGTRMSLSFNVFVKGNMGLDIDKTELIL